MTPLYGCMQKQKDRCMKSYQTCTNFWALLLFSDAMYLRKAPATLTPVLSWGQTHAIPQTSMLEYNICNAPSGSVFTIN